MLSLLPAVPAVSVGPAAGSRLPIVVAMSTLLPALLLGGIVWFTDRTVSLAPIAVWLFIAALAPRTSKARLTARWRRSRKLAKRPIGGTVAKDPRKGRAG